MILVCFLVVWADLSILLAFGFWWFADFDWLVFFGCSGI